MTLLGIDIIALFLGLLLLTPHRNVHGRLWRYAREQARSESNATTQTARLSPTRGSGPVAGAVSLPVESATTSAAARWAPAVRCGSSGGSSRLAWDL